MAANFSRHMGRRSNSLLISGLVSLNGRGNVIEGMLMLCGLPHYKGTRGEHKETRGPDRMNTIRLRGRYMNLTELVTVILQTYRFVKIVKIFYGKCRLAAHL